MATEMMLQEKVSVPEAIVRVLEEAGIDMVFGMPGGNTGRIFDALYDHRSTIRTVLTRQESLAGVMAEVYGRLTGKPGVAMGQGAFILSNALLGTMEGHVGCSPMLLIGDLTDFSPFTHHFPYQSGAGMYGSWDAKKSFEGVTKLAMVPTEGVQAVQSTQLAIKHALNGECGPVALLYHSAAFKGQVGPDSIPRIYPTSRYLPDTRLPAAASDVESAAQTLAGASRPVIIAGNGVRISKAYAELQGLSALLGAPVATTAAGKGVFAETGELALGVFGNFGLPVANAVIGEADVILTVGSKLGPTDTANENPKLIDPTRQTLIQIEIEPNNAGRTFPCEHVLIGDAATVLSQLTEAIRGGGNPSDDTLKSRKARLADARAQHGFFDAAAYTSDEKPMMPQRVIGEIHKAIADDAIVTCDAGENRLFMTHFFQTKGANTLISPAAAGGMGYAIPAALAAKLIYPERQVVSVCGDGGFAMAMNGLMNAADDKLPIVSVVLNNGALGWVMHGQRERVIASQLPKKDFAGMARAMGCRGVRVEDPGQLGEELATALRADEPTLLDVVTTLKATFADVTSPLVAY